MIPAGFPGASPFPGASVVRTTVRGARRRAATLAKIEKKPVRIHLLDLTGETRCGAIGGGLAGTLALADTTCPECLVRANALERYRAERDRRARERQHVVSFAVKQISSPPSEEW